MMRIRCGVIAWAMALSAAGGVWAQAPATVQLPSFSYFTVDTTVSVPDRGTASLGGVGRARTGSTAFGPALGSPNRAIGRSLSSSGISVRASVHDFEALDRATLQRAGTRRSPQRAAGAVYNRPMTTQRAAPPGSVGRKQVQGALSGRRATVAVSSAERPPRGSVADARRLHGAETSDQEVEVLSNLEHARRAAADGKATVARLFYKLALRRAHGGLKSQIDRELAALAN